MAYVFPGMLLPWVERRFTDGDGVPLAGGSISSFVAGTSTPLETYSDPDLDPMHANSVVITLNDNGCAPNRMYLLPRAYKFTVKDADGVVQPHYPFDDVLDDGQIFAEYFGQFLADGSKDVTSPYTTLKTDHLVTVASTGGPNPCIINLISAAEAVWPITIVNAGNVPLSIVPNGTNTISGVNGAITIPAAAYPVLPSVTLLPDGVSAWFVTSSTGLV